MMSNTCAPEFLWRKQKKCQVEALLYIYKFEPKEIKVEIF